MHIPLQFTSLYGASVYVPNVVYVVNDALVHLWNDTFIYCTYLMLCVYFPWPSSVSCCTGTVCVMQVMEWLCQWMTSSSSWWQQLRRSVLYIGYLYSMQAYWNSILTCVLAIQYLWAQGQPEKCCWQLMLCLLAMAAATTNCPQNLFSAVFTWPWSPMVLSMLLCSSLI